MNEKQRKVYKILLRTSEMNETKFNRLISIYGKDIVSSVIKRLINEDSANLDKFNKYLDRLDLEDDLVDSFDYYLADIAKIDMMVDKCKDDLLTEILAVIKKLDELFILAGCYNDIFGNGRKPWISDKVNYCLENCTDKELLNKINSLYSKYVIMRNKLIEGHLRFVISIAKDYCREYGLPFDDLIQYGNIGLIRAIEMYNPEFNTKFITYAGEWINQSIIANSKRTLYEIRKPSYIFELNNLRIKTINILTQKFGREPSSKEIADYVGLSLDHIEFVRKAFLETFSLDEPVETTIDGLYLTKKEYVVDENVDVEESVINNFLLDELNECLSLYLSDREIFILKSIYFDEMTLVEIASLLGISHQRVGQIHSRTLEKLSNKRRVKNMHVYLR